MNNLRSTPTEELLRRAYHLAKHLTDDGKEAPELQSLTDPDAGKSRNAPSPLALSDDDMDRLFNLTASGALTRADAISAIRKGLSA